MPFGLCNTKATFERAMDYAFRELVNKILLVYVDDITIFSHNKGSHIQHLEQDFIKSIFAVDEGKLLGYVILKEG